MTAHRALVAFSLLYLVAFPVAGVAEGRVAPAVTYLGTMAIAMLAVAYIDRRVRWSRITLWGLSLWGFAHMAGGLIAVGDRVLYAVQIVPVLVRYDQAVHAFGFGFGTLAAWEAMRRYLSSPKMTTGVAVLVALCGMGVGALNEVIEFFTTRVQEETNVGGYENTGWDLVFNTVGATLATVIVFVRDRAAIRSVAGVAEGEHRSA